MVSVLLIRGDHFLGPVVGGRAHFSKLIKEEFSPSHGWKFPILIIKLIIYKLWEKITFFCIVIVLQLYQKIHLKIPLDPLLWPDQQLNSVKSPHSSSCVFAQATRTFQVWILFHLFYKNKQTSEQMRWNEEGCIVGFLYSPNPNWAVSNLWGLALLFFLFSFFPFFISRQTFSNFVCDFAVMCYIQTFLCMGVCFSRSPPVIFPFFLPLSPAHQSPSFLIQFPFHFPVLFTQTWGICWNQREHDCLSETGFIIIAKLFMNYWQWS